ncbi:MAG: SH3 domain-containing protein [Phycisphaerae bacterium]|jgi:hypothetical protein
MRRLFQAALALSWAAMAIAGLGQTPPAEPEPAHYWLRVTADRVHLRNRPDRNSTAVEQFDHDAVLEAIDEQYGWHRIVPPEGVFSYVSATYIDQLDADRGVVSVASGRLRVRVGSRLTTLEPLRSEVQTRLSRGTEVRIVGRDGDWLQIVPPPNVFFYISNEFVERIDAETAQRLREEKAAAQPGATTEPAATSQPSDELDLTGKWAQRLVLIEAVIDAESRKPPLEQEWTGAREELRPLAEQREEPRVARLAAEWITRLQQREAEQAALGQARDIADRSRDARARFQREMEQIRRAREGATSRPAYAARGQLLRSYATGSEPSRPGFEILDPLAKRVVAYVELAPATTIDMTPFIGQYVGVRGEKRHDAALGADVVRATEIEILKRGEPTSQPARRNP